jgi:hypothetical protein
MQQDFTFSNLHTSDWRCAGLIPTVSDGNALQVLSSAKSRRMQDSLEDPGSRRDADGLECRKNLPDDDVGLILAACEELEAMFRVCETDATQITTAIYFEPVRSISLNTRSLQPPPKVFFRTFWRSLTKRLIRKMDETHRRN